MRNFAYFADTMQKRSLYLLNLLLGLACLLFSVLFNHSQVDHLPTLAQRSSKAFEDKQQQCLLLLHNLLNQTPGQKKEDFYNAFNSDGIALYTFQNDKLSFWNNARRPLVDTLFSYKKPFGLIDQKNGLYFYVRLQQKSTAAFAVCLVQSRFEIQNNYLKNNFETWTKLTKGIKVVSKNDAASAVELNHVPLFHIFSNEENFYNTSADDVASVLFIVGFFLIMLAALLSVFYGGTLWHLLLNSAALLVFRTIILFFNLPAFLYRSSLYDLHVFGDGQTRLNAYLGDIFINAFLILYVAFALHLFAQKNKRYFWLRAAQLICFVFLFFQINDNLQSLVHNSTLSFDFVNVFANNFMLLPVFGIFAAYAMALYLFLKALCQPGNATKQQFLAPLIVALLTALLYQWTHASAEWYLAWWMFFFVLCFVTVYIFSRQNQVLSIVAHVLLYSFVLAGLLHKQLQKNRLMDYDLMAQNLSEKRDAILESEYNLIPEKIQSDGNFKNLLNLLPSADDELIQKLKQDYFSGYFDRYNLEFSLFDEQCNPLLPVKNPLLVNQGYFADQISQSVDSLPHALYFFSNHNMPARYIAYIPVLTKRLYVLMEPKQFEETGSFPDLLIDQSLQKQNKLHNVSFAVYHGGVLTNRNGDFIYPDFYDNLPLAGNAEQTYQHHLFTPESDTQVVISEPGKGWKYYFTFNSYVLLIFSAIIYLAYIFYLIFFTSLFTISSLTRRIQTIIILLLLGSMSAVGIISANLVIKQFENKNQKQLSEKTQTMLSELTGQFKPSQLFDSDQYNLINLKLKEYARLFNTPVSMFDSSGALINTSETKLYDLGLAAKLANPKAFTQLKNREASSVCVNEKAGTLDYMSMYTPIYDASKKLIGMINLPYFARQSDLSNELSGIISALINVYVILIVLSVLAGLILAGYITRPLRLIQQQIAKISLGKKNEKITWHSKDEIGKLVFEYNQMLLKLEESANQLAQSERESAWREMAKQVAHEIKNPLTPMKLNLQYLQHLRNANPSDFTEKFEKVSLGIIEQIDSLATIAGEFSNFAKLPDTQLQNIHLHEIIVSAAAIFENQASQIIKIEVPENIPAVKGDRDQCLRVFNNILKNAVQAIEGRDQPRIRVTWVKEKPGVTIAIEDNGCGIDDSLKQKIFSPNFTTKSTGSGLGLAMVKNCLQGFGGNVYVDSKVNQGSTFYLQFMPVNPES